MGCCGSSIPDEILDDPTGPSTFYLKKAGTFSSNFKIQADGHGDEGKPWLLLTKKGKWGKDDAILTIENYKRNEGEKFGQALAVCKFDTLDREAVKQYGVETHEDSDDSDSDHSDSDEETEFKQKTKWALKTSSKFYLDRERKQPMYKLKVKAKGKAKRIIEFRTTEDEEGNEKTTVSSHIEVKPKKLIYRLTPLYPAAEESKGEEPEEIPLELKGKLKGSLNAMEWQSPLFRAQLEGRGGSKPVIETFPGANPAVTCLIGYVVTIELAPDDMHRACHQYLRWPRVDGPNDTWA